MRGTSEGALFAGRSAWLLAGTATGELAQDFSSARAKRMSATSQSTTVVVASSTHAESRAMRRAAAPRIVRCKPALHRRLRNAGLADQRLPGAVLERDIRRQHHRAGTDLLVLDVDTRRRHALVGQRLGGAHQAVPRHDDAVVGGDQVLLGAIANRPHAFLQGRILNGKAGDATEGLAGFLRRAVNQIIVVLVGERPVGAGDVFAMHA